MNLFKSLFTLIFKKKSNNIQEITDGIKKEPTQENNVQEITDGIKKEPIQKTNEKAPLKNDYELFIYDEKFKSKSYYKQYHTLLNHFFSRLKCDLDLSQEQMQELVNRVVERVDDIVYVEIEQEDSNGDMLTPISGRYNIKEKTILLNAAMQKANTNFNVITELYKQLLNAITLPLLDYPSQSTTLYCKICNEYIANRISNNSMLKDDTINTQCFNRCIAIVPFIGNLLSMDEKDYLRDIIMQPDAMQSLNGALFLEKTGGENVYDGDGIEQFPDLVFNPVGTNLKTTNLFALQLQGVPPYYVDLSHGYSHYQFFNALESISFAYYSENRNPYFEECRKNLNIYMSGLLGKQHLEEELNKTEHIQYSPILSKYMNGISAFESLKREAIKAAEEQIASIPKYTDEILEMIEIEPDEEQRKNSREHIGKWDNRILDEEIRKATWMTKVNVNENNTSMDRITTTLPQNKEYLNSEQR